MEPQQPATAAPSFQRYGGSYLRYTSVDVITHAGVQFAILDRKTSQPLRARIPRARTWLFVDMDEGWRLREVRGDPVRETGSPA